MRSFYTLLIIFMFSIPSVFADSKATPLKLNYHPRNQSVFSQIKNSAPKNPFKPQVSRGKNNKPNGGQTIVSSCVIRHRCGKPNDKQPRLSCVEKEYYEIVKDGLTEVDCQSLANRVFEQAVYSAVRISYNTSAKCNAYKRESFNHRLNLFQYLSFRKDKRAPIGKVELNLGKNADFSKYCR